MLIKTAEFAGSAKQKKDYFNHQFPEIVVVGKSNVGKSSLINALTGNGKLARVSKQPGKTRLINFFLLNRQFYLVDLPGYGFARASKIEKESWEEMMHTYFENSEQLQAAILLLDIRHKPTKEDIAMLHYIEYYAIPYVVCLTRQIKLQNPSAKMRQCISVRRFLPLLLMIFFPYLQKSAMVSRSCSIIWNAICQKKISKRNLGAENENLCYFRSAPVLGAGEADGYFWAKLDRALGKDKKSWRACVLPEDIVIVAGDLSWAMNYEAAKPDLDAICQLPGQKVLIRGKSRLLAQFPKN